MEYLFVRGFIEGVKECTDVEWTDQMNVFLREMFIDATTDRKGPLYAHIASGTVTTSQVKILITALSTLKGHEYAPGTDYDAMLFALMNIVSLALHPIDPRAAQLLVVLKGRDDSSNTSLLRTIAEYSILTGKSKRALPEVRLAKDNIDEFGIPVFSQSGEVLGLIAFMYPNQAYFHAAFHRSDHLRFGRHIKPLLQLFAEFFEAQRRDEIARMSNY